MWVADWLQFYPYNLNDFTDNTGIWFWFILLGPEYTKCLCICQNNENWWFSYKLSGMVQETITLGPLMYRLIFLFHGS